MTINRAKTFQVAIIAVFVALVMAAIIVTVPSAMGQSSDETGQKAGRRGARSHFIKGRGPRGMSARMFRGLDMTDEQKAQIRQIHESHRESIKAIRQQINAERQSLRQAQSGGTFDEAAVSQKLAALAPLQAKLMGERFRVQQETLSVLTSDQKAKLDQMREQWKAKRAERSNRKSRR